MRIGRIFLASLFGFCLVTSSFSADEQSPTDPQSAPPIEETVVVTASYREVPLEWAGNAVTVLTREDLARKGNRTLVEALSSVPGLQANTTGAGGMSTVMIRGAQSEQTVVMVDGVELNDPMSPGRGYEFGVLTLDNVDRIEVVRGPQSMVHGSDAMGGIVNIITRDGGGKANLVAQFEGGRFAWSNSRLEGSGQTAGFRWAAGFSHQQIDGWSSASPEFGNRERDGQTVNSLNAKLSRSLGKGFEAAFSFHGNKYRQDMDSFGGYFGDDPNYRATGCEAAFSAELRHTPGRGVFRHRVTFSYLDSERKYLDDPDPDHPNASSDALYRGIRKKLRWQGDLSCFQNQFISFGAEYSREQGHSRYESDGPWGPSFSAFDDQQATMASLFFEDRLQFGDYFSLTGGARFDHHDLFGGHTSFRLSPVFAVPGVGTRIRFSVGTGFKAPSLYQLYAPPTDWGAVGNAALQPETSWALDGGLTQTLGGGALQISAGFFYNRFNNLIDYVYGYQNVGRARTWGLEVEAKFCATKNLSIYGNYTYVEADNLLTGEPLLRRAPHTATLGFEYKPSPDWFITAESLVRGRRWDMDYSAWPAARVRLEPRAVVNLSVTRRIGRNAEAFFRVDNLFDNKHPDVYGYAAEPLLVRGGLRLLVGQ